MKLTDIKIRFTSKQEMEDAKMFMDRYKYQKELVGGVPLKLKDEIQKCRFCKKSKGQTTFKQKTHIIPQSLCKSLPTSNFECDECNSKFSKFESDFGHFLLPERTLFGLKNKKSKYTKLKHPNGGKIQRLKDHSGLNLTEEQLSKIEKDGVAIINFNQGSNNEFIEIIEEGKQLKIKLTRAPYKPLNVYKVFLKIALSMIDFEEINEFKYLNNILSKNYPDFEIPTNKLFRYTFPEHRNYFPYPIAILWRTKDSTDLSYVSKYLVLYIANIIYQIPIFNDKQFDILIKDKGSIDFILMSPHINPINLFTENKDEFVGKELFARNFKQWTLDSKEIINDDNETIKLIFN